MVRKIDAENDTLLGGKPLGNLEGLREIWYMKSP